MNALMHLRIRLQQSPIWVRWQQLSASDRMALGLLGGFLLLVLVYLLAWRPLEAWAARAQAYQAQQQETFLYIQQNAAQARASALSTQTELDPEQLQGTVTSTAKQHGLVLERIDSEGAGVLVTLAAAPFEAVLRWLGDLNGKGISLAEASLDRGSAGQVDARLTLVLSGAGGG